jgi:hypothetical protein
MQPSTGQTAWHFGASPSHSVQDEALMMKVPPFAEIDALGHSNSHAPQEVHSSAFIASAMSVSFLQAMEAARP